MRQAKDQEIANEAEKMESSSAVEEGEAIFEEAIEKGVETVLKDVATVAVGSVV